MVIKIASEVACWNAKAGIFSRDSRPWAWESNHNMLTWWRGFFGDTVLSLVVSAIACIPATSVVAYRNRNGYEGFYINAIVFASFSLKTSTASMQNYIKHNLSLEFSHLFKIADETKPTFSGVNEEPTNDVQAPTVVTYDPEVDIFSDDEVESDDEEMADILIPPSTSILIPIGSGINW